MENEREPIYLADMRKLLPLLMIAVLLIGPFRPTMTQAHPGNAPSLAETHAVLVAIDDTTSLECHEKSTAGDDQRQDGCTADCHFLTEVRFDRYSRYRGTNAVGFDQSTCGN